MHLVIAIEELAELAQEISKELRGKGSIVGFAEDLADVHVAIRYVHRVIGIRNEVLDKAVSVKNNYLEQIVCCPDF